MTATTLDRIASSLPAMLEAIEALVTVESPSSDHAAVARCAALANEIGAALLGTAAEVIDTGGVSNLRWSFGTPAVVLVGHIDTVWPMGTLAEWPFRIEGGRATGPGVFDMKTGVVQALHAMASLADPDGVCLLITGDEELGSPSTRDLIESTTRGAKAALILEPSAAGALKTARKGVSMYDIHIEGREAHAGLEPEKGVNALVELAHQIPVITSFADAAAGTTVTPTVARAGTTRNTVPRDADVLVDVRCTTVAEQERVDRSMQALRAVLPDAAIRVDGGPNRPPLEERMSKDLFALAEQIAGQLNLPPLRAVAVGGGSDGNFTAGIGVPTLDGLGAVGDGAHARGEYVEVDSIPERTALVVGLIDAIRSRGG